MALGLGRLRRHAGHVATVGVALWQGGPMDLAYRIVNVFTVGDDPFSGNPLAVFEDAADVSDEQMQAIARQLNLSETTFVTGPGGDGVDADVHIFTPEYELPFAGHPTLGTAYVVSSLLSGRESVVLGMPAGRVPVSLNGSRWVLTTAVAPTTRAVDVMPADLAAMIGVDADDVGEGPLWVDTGVEQLILPLRSVEAVRRAHVDARLLRRTASRTGARRWSTSGRRPGTIPSRRGCSSPRARARSRTRRPVRPARTSADGGTPEASAGSAASSGRGTPSTGRPSCTSRWTLTEASTWAAPSTSSARASSSSRPADPGPALPRGRPRHSTASRAS